MDEKELLTRAVEFDFGWPNDCTTKHPTERIIVRKSALDSSTWKVTCRGEVWDNTPGEEGFIYEPSPSNRTADFIVATRYPLHEACRIAADIVTGKLKDQVFGAAGYRYLSKEG